MLREIAAVPHARPRVFVDAELARVPERHAPGIGTLQRKLQRAVGATPVTALPHEKLLARINAAGRAFHVLLIKTRELLPYTSVFCELECKYWTDEAERRLRRAASNRPVAPLRS